MRGCERLLSGTWYVSPGCVGNAKVNTVGSGTFEGICSATNISEFVSLYVI